MASGSVLIRGGMVYRDRTFEDADVLIEKGTVKKIGDFSGAISKEIENVIDAAGKYVVPGFIDLTNHSDTHWTLFAYPAQESMLMQGVTTILGGNCGSSLAPLVKGGDISGIQKWTDISKINIDWRTLEEFFEGLSRHPLGVNFGTLVGHGTLRRGVIGEDTRPAKEDEIRQMQLLLERAMAEGAFGLSTSLGSSHEKGADYKELLALFSAVDNKGGLTKHHLKDEGKNILPAIAEIIGLARDANATAVLSHFKFIGRSAWESADEAFSMIESARTDGVKLWCDVFPYTRTGSPLYQLLPPWAVEGGKEKILLALKESGARAEILAHIKSLTLHYEKITVAATLHDRAAIGKTIAELAATSGIGPEEVIATLLENNDLKVSIFNEVILPEHLEALAKKEYSLFASDGVGYGFQNRDPFDLPHPRSFGAFPTALEMFGKNEKSVPFEELVYKMTELPANILGLKNRGKLAEGYVADIAVFDPARIASSADYLNPYAPPVGVDWVLVSGKFAVEDGAFTGGLHGAILYKT